MPSVQRPRAIDLLTPQVLRCSSTESTVVSTTNEKAKKTQTKKCSAVTFNETVSVRPISHYSNMTMREIRDTWYSRSEMITIKRNLVADVADMVIMGQPKDPELFTARGLEYRTKKGSKLHLLNKLNGIEAVLHAQAVQRMTGISEPDGIRHAYLQQSERCLALAQVRGVQDEIETLDYLGFD